jgi:hypothetical protein
MTAQEYCKIIDKILGQIEHNREILLNNPNAIISIESLDRLPSPDEID